MKKATRQQQEMACPHGFFQENGQQYYISRLDGEVEQWSPLVHDCEQFEANQAGYRRICAIADQWEREAAAIAAIPQGNIYAQAGWVQGKFTVNLVEKREPSNAAVHSDH
jgi:hypothetical protein